MVSSREQLQREFDALRRPRDLGENFGYESRTAQPTPAGNQLRQATRLISEFASSPRTQRTRRWC